MRGRSSPAQRPCTEKKSPQKFWLWRPGAYFGKVRGLWETETPPLKGKISHTLRPSAEAVIWKEPGSDPPADLRESPGGNWSSPWGHRLRWSCFGDLVLPQKHWYWQTLDRSPPSSLFLPGAHLPTSQSEPVLRPSGSSSQLWGEPAPNTSGLTPVPGLPIPCSQLYQDPSLLNSSWQPSHKAGPDI